jgi:hypothetical protein
MKAYIKRCFIGWCWLCSATIYLYALSMKPVQIRNAPQIAITITSIMSKVWFDTCHKSLIIRSEWKLCNMHCVSRKCWSVYQRHGLCIGSRKYQKQASRTIDVEEWGFADCEKRAEDDGHILMFSNILLLRSSRTRNETTRISVALALLRE